ncbi:HFX_2341 family transcriptional regulator domain-containing protein [Halostagnicola kamekurae]|uniref:CRISPR-associated protein (Cas_Cas02710) n=1 Tax=Halostagnicola kamekurae TaxID=619731 RepID=A0A1I6QV41_9EURY|nr:DUF6293 family protein [Halostagnicola kamekurae]SFS56289.1 hypothetical protein SAMN04488556_1594 [Halostagnicola kamekurae]
MQQSEFDFKVENRVHIMPIGFEFDRAHLPAKELKADTVILLMHESDDDDEEDRIKEIQDKLDEYGIDSEKDKCRLFNMYDALGMIAEKINEFSSEDVYVNLSTGGKVTAIAGMIACMVADATPYYVQAKDYGPTPPEGVAEITKLPRYPIDSPDYQEIAVLNFIKERTSEDSAPTKGELIEFGEEIGLPFIADHDVEQKGKYRLLDNHVINPLEDDGYVTTEKKGREKIVKLTSDGQNTLHAFRYLIEDEYTVE